MNELKMKRMRASLFSMWGRQLTVVPRNENKPFAA